MVALASLDTPTIMTVGFGRQGVDAMRESRQQVRSSVLSLRDGLSVAVRSSVVGAVLGGLLAAAVGGIEPIWLAYEAWAFAAMLGKWAAGGAIVAFIIGSVVSIVAAKCGVARVVGGNSCSQVSRSHAPRTRSRRFWRAYWVSLPIVAFVSIIPFWRTYRSGVIDGYELVGWPFAFYARGGMEGGVYYNLDVLAYRCCSLDRVGHRNGACSRDMVRIGLA